MLVSTKSGILVSLLSGSLGPKTWVSENPTSSAMYVVAAKNARTKKLYGCAGEKRQHRRHILVEAGLTIRALSVPSSTTCVLTMAFPSSAQNVAATSPACTAVTAVSAVDPCFPKSVDLHGRGKGDGPARGRPRW